MINVYYVSTTQLVKIFLIFEIGRESIQLYSNINIYVVKLRKRIILLNFVVMVMVGENIQITAHNEYYGKINKNIISVHIRFIRF